MHRLQQKFAFVLACSVALAEPAAGFASPPTQAMTPSTVPSVEQTPAQMEQLVAPIALYPDPLVSEMLSAATYPDQIVEAATWMREHPGLQGNALAKEVNRQSWDSSVKALVQMPAVLANMDQNMTWTTALGDAYINREQDVVNAIQEMRRRAQAAGNLASNAQQTVISNGAEIQIQPVNPTVIYVPQYDPWIVYGTSLAAWPGWYWYPGLWWDGPGIGFGLGFGIGFGFHGGFHHGGFHGAGFHSRGFHGGGFHGGGFHGGSFHGGSFHRGGFAGGGFHGGGFHGGGFHGGHR
jgi:hypothetical protein